MRSRGGVCSLFLVPGSLFFVLCSWCLVLCSLFFVLGSWFLVLGSSIRSLSLVLFPPLGTNASDEGRPRRNHRHAGCEPLQLFPDLLLNARPQCNCRLLASFSLWADGSSRQSLVISETSVEQRSHCSDRRPDREFRDFHAAVENQRETTPGWDLV